MLFVGRRNRNDELLLRDDDLLILEMKTPIQHSSLKDHITKENEIAMTIRTGIREEFKEIQINIT